MCFIKSKELLTLSVLRVLPITLCVPSYFHNFFVFFLVT